MNLYDHFKQYASRDLAASRQAILESIARDSKALNELDFGYEVWIDIDLDKLGSHLLTIAREMQKNGARSIEARAAYRQVAELVVDNWFDHILKYIDAQYGDIDIAALTEFPPEGVA